MTSKIKNPKFPSGLCEKNVLQNQKLINAANVVLGYMQSALMFPIKNLKLFLTEMIMYPGTV